VAGGNRKSADHALALALARGLTVRRAAVRCQLSESTVYRRLRSKAFRAKVDEIRAGMVSRTVGRLGCLGGRAVQTLRKILQHSPDVKAKLGAARAVLAHLFRNADGELAREVEELKRLLKEAKRVRGPLADGEPDAGGGEGPGAGGEPGAGAPPAGPGGGPDPGGLPPRPLPGGPAPLDFLQALDLGQ
jgi:hypothetical protein